MQQLKSAFASLLVVTAASWALPTVAAEATQNIGTPLTLSVSIPDPSVLGTRISLRDGNGCTFVGQLQRTGGENEKALDAKLMQKLGLTGSWSIAVTQKACQETLTPVSLRIPLRNLETSPGYMAGDVVIAFQTAAGR